MAFKVSKLEITLTAKWAGTFWPGERDTAHVEKVKEVSEE